MDFQRAKTSSAMVQVRDMPAFCGFPGLGKGQGLG